MTGRDTSGRDTTGRGVIGGAMSGRDATGGGVPDWQLQSRDLARSPRLEAAMQRIAARTGRPVAALLAEAATCLDELRTGFSGRVHRRIIRAGRALCRSGYDAIEYDPSEVARLRELSARQAIVVLSSHRSYLDGGALNVGFADNGLPPLTVFAGINMAFWPIGAIWRRAQTVFIRRQGADEVYKAALREVVGTLVEQRRALQWFIEGTRSRTGHMGEPRIGLLAYVVDAVRDSRTDDVSIVPISVTYERLREVSDYAAEARGSRKRREGLGWLFDFVRAQRGRFGRIYVRCGEPLPVRAAMAEQGDSPQLLPWLAAEAMRRIRRATTITGSALVATALDAGSPTAASPTAASATAVAAAAAEAESLTSTALRERALALAERARRQGLPLASTAALDAPGVLEDVLAGLEAQGLVERIDATGDASDTAWRIAPGARDALAYYANTIAHAFETPAD